MKTDKLITRFLDGLTSLEEERLLSETLEAQTTLTEDERAVLDLLRLTFPEEDTAALLTEDLSTEFERMANDESRMTNKIFLQQLMVTSIRHSSSLIHHWPFAIMATAAAILIAFLLWPKSNKDTITQQEVQPIVAETNSQPVPQPAVEEKKEETVMAVMQATPQPVKKRRKAVKKQSIPIEEPAQTETEQPIHERDIEPMYAQTEEKVTPYHTMQTIHLSSDVVVYVIEASDIPDVSMMPSVSELRARGLRLKNYVRQASQTTVQF